MSMLRTMLAVSMVMAAAAALPATAALPSLGTTAVLTPASEDLAAAVAETLRQAVEVRFSSCCGNSVVAGNDRHSAPPVAVTVQSLHEIAVFARSTAAGLAAVAQDPADRQRLEVMLGRELTALDGRLQETLFDLLADPATGAKGWFVVSRFGDQLESMAGELVTRADVRPDSVESLSRRIADLAARGEASVETARRISALVSGQRLARR
jgi:hypothetical protein